jgi:hypothetical protein
MVADCGTLVKKEVNITRSNHFLVRKMRLLEAKKIKIKPGQAPGGGCGWTPGESAAAPRS